MEVKRLGNIYGFTGGSYAGAVYDVKGIAPSIDTMSGGNRQPMIVRMQGRNTSVNEVEYKMCYRIRKLTPMECWRLMDFTDIDFQKAAAVVSNSQLYKQAGNSIVVNVLVAIIGQMIEGKEDMYKERI